MRTKLLCTFTDIKSYDDEVKKLSLYYEIVYDRLYVLQDTDDLNSLLLTYNINQDTFNSSNFYKNTISVHRKKDSNTLYTINALNELIKKLNGGVVDTRFPIDWQHYRNTILLTQHDELKQLKTKIHKILEV